MVILFEVWLQIVHIYNGKSNFLGFQVKQLQDGTFISQTKYIQDILTKFGMKDAKPIKTPMGTNGHLNLDTGGKFVDQKV